MNLFELYASVTLKTDDYKKSLAEVESDSEKTAESLNTRSIAMGTTLGNLLTKGIDFVAQYGKLAIMTGIDYNRQIETYSAALTTALGSEAAAAAAIEQIKKDAAATPYSVDGLIKANQLLIAAGISADDSRATILALTDAISATGGGNEELKRMAQNLQQVKNVGKATAQDIKQFQMAGIEVYGLIADYTGMAVSDVQKLDISYELLAGALQHAASEGGKFYQANARQAQTLNGQLSTLSDNVNQKLGEAFSDITTILSGQVLPAANKFISSLDVSVVISSFKKLIPVISTVGAMLVATKAQGVISGWISSITKLVASYMTLTQTMTLAEISQTALNGKMMAGQVIVGVMAGDISLATAAQVAWNAAVAAFPAALIVAGIAAIGFAVADYVSDINAAQIDTDALKESLTGLVPDEAVDKAVALAHSMNDLQTQIQYTQDLLNDAQLYGFTDEIDSYQTKLDSLNAEYDKLSGQLNAIKTEAGLMSDATDSAAGSLEDLGDAADSASEELLALQELQDQFTKDMDKVVDKYKKTYDSITKAVNGWFGTFDKAKVDVKTSVNEMMEAMQSQIDFNNTYSQNLEKIRSYDLPLVAEAFQSMGAEGSAYAQALVDAVESAGGATSEAGQDIIKNFNELSEGVADSRSNLRDELMSMSGEAAAEMANIISGFEQSVADMNMSGEAAAAAAATVGAYIDGIAAGAGPAGAAAAAVAAAAANGLSPVGGGGGPKGGNGRTPGVRLAVGSDYIPYDDFPALLHKGEMVVPAKISEDLRDFLRSPTDAAAAPSGGGISEIIGLLQALLRKDSNLYIDGKRMASELAPDTDDALGAVNTWRGRGLSMT